MTIEQETVLYALFGPIFNALYLDKPELRGDEVKIQLTMDYLVVHCGFNVFYVKLSDVDDKQERFSSVPNFLGPDSSILSSTMLNAKVLKLGEFFDDE